MDLGRDGNASPRDGGFPSSEPMAPLSPGISDSLFLVVEHRGESQNKSGSTQNAKEASRTSAQSHGGSAGGGSGTDQAQEEYPCSPGTEEAMANIDEAQLLQGCFAFCKSVCCALPGSDIMD